MNLTITDHEVKSINEVAFYAEVHLASSVATIEGVASYIWEAGKYAASNPQDEGKGGFTFDDLAIEEASVMLESFDFRADESDRKILADSIVEQYTEKFVEWEELLLEQEED